MNGECHTRTAPEAVMLFGIGRIHAYEPVAHGASPVVGLGYLRIRRAASNTGSIPSIRVRTGAPVVTRSRWSSGPATAQSRRREPNRCDITREMFPPAVEYLCRKYAAVVRAIWERSRKLRDDADGTLDSGDFAAKFAGYGRYYAARAWRRDFDAEPVAALRLHRWPGGGARGASRPACRARVRLPPAPPGHDRVAVGPGSPEYEETDGARLAVLHGRYAPGTADRGCKRGGLDVIGTWSSCPSCARAGSRDVTRGGWEMG